MTLTRPPSAVGWGFSRSSEGAASPHHSWGAALQKRRANCPSNIISHHPQQDRLVPHLTDGESEVKSLARSHRASEQRERGSDPRLPAGSRLPQLAARATLSSPRPASSSHPGEGRRARPQRSVPRPLIAGRPRLRCTARRRPRRLSPEPAPGAPRRRRRLARGNYGHAPGGGRGRAAPREHKLCKYPGAARGRPAASLHSRGLPRGRGWQGRGAPIVGAGT